MRLIALVLAACVCFLPLPLKAAETAFISNCTLEPDEEAQIPAQEAGADGNPRTRGGSGVGQAPPRADRRRDSESAAGRGLLQAAGGTKKSKTTSISVSPNGGQSGQVEYDEAEDANRKVPNTVTHSEVLRRLLDWHKMNCRPRRRKRTSSSPRWRRKCQGRVADAEANIKRRRIEAPPGSTGRASPGRRRRRTYAARRSMVQIGEPVMRLVCMDACASTARSRPRISAPRRSGIAS